MTYNPGDKAKLSAKHWLVKRHGTDVEILEHDPNQAEFKVWVQFKDGIRVWTAEKELTVI